MGFLLKSALIKSDICENMRIAYSGQTPMRQQTFIAGDFERYRKPARREQLLAKMDRVAPWGHPCALTNLYMARR
jgi:hypothetical protein